MMLATAPSPTNRVLSYEERFGSEPQTTTEFTFEALPIYDIFGLLVRPVEAFGRTNPGSPIEHRVLIGFDGAIAHVPGPADVFRPGRLQDILTPGARIRIVNPTRSLEETDFRFSRANQLMGVPWWNMDCHRTADFIAGFRQNSWLTRTAD